MHLKGDGIDIFISHSHQDEKLADELASFLEITFQKQKIRCTSVPRFKLEPGASVEETLRREIHESRVFIGLITPASLTSHFVLFELGARWGARRDLIPVLALGADSTDLQEPLKNRNPVRCDVRAEVHSLVNKIASVLGVPPSNIAYKNLVNALVRKAKPGGQTKRKKEEVKASGAESATSTEAEDAKRKGIRTLLSQEIVYNVKYLNGINDSVKSEEIKYRETFKTDEYGAWSSEGNPIRALRRFQPDSLSQRAWASQIEQAPLALTEDELASVISFYGALNGISSAQEKFLSAPTVSDFFDEVVRRIDAILEDYPKLQ